MTRGLRLGCLSTLSFMLLSLCQLAQCSGANFAPQLLVACLSYVITPLVKLHEL